MRLFVIRRFRNSLSANKFQLGPWVLTFRRINEIFPLIDRSSAKERRKKSRKVIRRRLEEIRKFRYSPTVRVYFHKIGCTNGRRAGTLAGIRRGEDY